MSKNQIAKFLREVEQRINIIDKEAAKDVFVNFGAIIDDYDEFIPQVLDLTEKMLKSENKDNMPLNLAYIDIAGIAEKRPDFGKKVFEVINFALESKNNNERSYISAQRSLKKLAETNPEFKNNVEESLKLVPNRYRNMDLMPSIIRKSGGRV